jgi:hypothetical protein
MLDSYRELLEGLTNAPTELRALLGDPVPDDIDPAVADGLRALLARETVELVRVRTVLHTPNAELRAIDREPALNEPPDTSISPEEALRAFSGERSELVALLMNVTLTEWERTVNHQVTGETSLADEIEDHLAWDEAQIDRFRSQATT